MKELQARGTNPFKQKEPPALFTITVKRVNGIFQ